MRLRILVPYDENITYTRMLELLEEEATRLGWRVMKTSYYPDDFQTEIVRDLNNHEIDITYLSISARVYVPYDGKTGLRGADPHAI